MGCGVTRSTRRLVAAGVTGVVAAAALAAAWTVINLLGVSWGVLVIVLGVVLVRFTPSWWVVWAPDDVTSWAALLPALWRWADRGQGDADAEAAGAPTPGRPDADAPRIADRPAPGRW